MNSICERKCDKCILNKTCGGCSLCEASVCGKGCKACSVLCARRPGAIGYLNSLGGPEYELVENRDIDICEHIPIIPDRLRKTIEYDIMSVVGVHAGNMFSRSGNQINKRYLEKGINRALNLDDRCKAILEFYVKDRTLEGFWDNRKEIYRDIKKLGFKGVIAPNFSVYEDAPRIDHMYNIKRSVLVYNELVDEGVNTIPDISWFNRKDLDRWCEQINKNNIKIISFSFQVVDIQLKASNIWKSYILGFRYLCQNIKPSIKIIIAGVTSHRRLIEIFRAACGQRMYVLNQSAYIQSVRGMLSEGRQRELSMPKDIILEKNIIYFNNIYKELNKRSYQGDILCQKQEEVIL